MPKRLGERSYCVAGRCRMARYRPHYGGSYRTVAQRLVATANADQATTCGRCGLRLDEHSPHANGRPAFWTAGHVIDSQVDGPLRPEASTCNMAAGGRLGAARSRGVPTSRSW